MRANLESAQVVHPGDGAAAGADALHRHAAQPDHLVLDAPVGRHRRLPLVDEADIGGGAAHVQGDGIGLLHLAEHVLGGGHAGRGAGHDHADGAGLARGQGHHAAVGLDDPHVAAHPGGVQVSLEPETFGRYISLDFGIVGTLTEVDKEYLAQNFSAFFRRDYKRVAELHIESGWVPATTRVDELESAVRACCEPYFDRPLKEISLGLVLMRLFQTSRRFNVEIQPQLVLLQKTLLNIEGLGRQLDPDLDLWGTAKPFLEKWMLEQVGPEKLFAQLKVEAPTYAKLLPGLPRLLSQYLKAPPGINRRELESLLAEQKRTNKLLQSLIYGGLGFVLGLIAMQFVLRIRVF